MNVDSVITLEDDKKWELLEKINYQDETYFLANQVDTKDYAILKEIKDNDEFYVTKVDNKEELLEILKIMAQNFGEELKNKKIEDFID